ncbi:alpha-(1-_3)-arabinofuranosyltransferase [Nocardioides pantholopis]|uniref:alpha-(1->3)-arabinofuranosyltransferase n=1 Tax=Nocardioides pantholopis TaxID=2483798 RepID=UPI0013E2E1CD|nr:alpha-(1->3)-arabinofuranosyltransferase [Nocardioides pantholopis]
MSDTTDERTRFRFRIAAACALLVGLAFVQDPGFLVPDTKFDLVVAPGEFLSRALHLWDGEGAFGQLQNQAYGYLWPMGPFFWLGLSAGLPAWVVQRLWMALVLTVAFTGAAKVTRALGVRSDLACIAAGLAFALSPRMLTTLGPISIEAWPSALAPWVLLPLVIGAERGSARRAAALSALAVAMVGGVNAAATFAVIPMGAIWLLTRTPGPRRRALMLWWPVFTVLGTLWWLVPLFVMGAYSPPFLDYIETTSVTTFPTTLFDVLRGTSNWVPYVDAGSRAGNDLLRTPYLILNGAVVLGLGLVGLLGRWCPHRRFLVLSLLAGVLMVGAGHAGAVEGWFSADLRGLLDGVLAPLRNVHKFDPLVRLPLVIGFAVVLDRVLARRVARSTSAAGAPDRGTMTLERVNRVAVVAMALTALLGATLPVVSGRVTPAGAHLEVPDYWSETADWLAEEGEETTALLVPGAPFGEYLWGSPKDEPLQYLAESPWAVRNVIPLTRAGNIRMLDGVESRLAQGAGSPGLTAALRRAGVRHLVVRNDLGDRSDVPDPVLVHQALRDSPGLVRVASFGPELGGGAVLDDDQGDRVVVNGGWQARYPAVEVFRVAGTTEPAVSAASATTLVGGPEDLADLLDLGVVGTEPTVLAADGAQPEDGVDGPVVLTDGLQAREHFFARIHDGSSAVLTPGDRRRSGNPARDYLLDDAERWSTSAVLDGAASLSASSSGSDSDTAGGPRPGELPYAAVDGDPGTQWRSGSAAGRAWWRLDLADPRAVSQVTLRGGPDAADNQVLRVRTAAGVSEPVQLAAGETRRVVLPAGETAWVRIEDAGPGDQMVAVAEVEVPGVEVRRRLALPEIPAAWGTPAAVVVRALGDARRGCAEVDDTVRCLAERARAPEEASAMGRVLTLPESATWQPELSVRPVAGRALDRAMLRGQAVDVQASSTAVPDSRASAVAAIDGSAATTWLAAPDDLRPTLTLNWLGKRRVGSVRVALNDTVAARRPTRVSVSWPGGTREVALNAQGVGRFPRVRTDTLQVRIERTDATASLGFDAQPQAIGVGISEMSVGGVPYLPLGLSEDRRDLGCGSGPVVSVAGARYASAVVASSAELLAGKAVEARLCSTEDGTISTPAGRSVIDVAGSDAFAPASLVLRDADPGAAALPAGAQAARLDLGSSTRRVEPTEGAGLVVLRQNANPGWLATQDGAELEPVVVDGWQQGWRLDGDGPVEARFAPDTAYRTGLAVGAACLLVLLGAVLVLRRRWRGPEHPPLAERELPSLLVLALALLGAGLVAGWVGLLLGAVAAAAAYALRASEPTRALLFAAPAVVVGAGYAIQPWGDPSGWAGDSRWLGYLLVVSVVGLVVSLAEGRIWRRGIFSRSAGRSTTR